MAAVSAAPELVVGMPEDEVRLRLKVYDRGGDFSRQLAELWERAGSILLDVSREHIESMVARLSQTETVEAETRMLRQRMMADAVQHAQRKFSNALSPEWIDAICQRAKVIAARNVAVAVIVAGIAEIAQRATRQIVDTLDLSEAELAGLCNTVHEAAVYETEILLWQIGELRRQEAAMDRTRHAATFHALVSRSVEHALESSNLLADETQRTIHGSRATLANISEVAQAAQQSANAMRDAAETAANLSNAIDAVASGLTGVLSAEQRASQDADTARAAAEELSAEIGAISSVADLIRDIAGQTNMLALNATIEAARAGDAGRGFAVVAQEVKSLASQTKRATDQIAQRIGAIHGASARAAQRSDEGQATMIEARAALHDMVATMKSQFDRVTAIAAAVEQTSLAALSTSELVTQVHERTRGMTGDLERLNDVFTDVAGDLATLKSGTDEFVGVMGAA